MKASNIYIRIVYDCILLLSVFFLPWYISLILGIIGLIYFENYVELLVSSFLIDSLYGVSGSRAFGFSFFHTVLGAFLFLVYGIIKDNVRITR
jgi:hypothetical protein